MKQIEEIIGKEETEFLHEDFEDLLKDPSAGYNDFEELLLDYGLEMDYIEQLMY